MRTKTRLTSDFCIWPLLCAIIRCCAKKKKHTGSVVESTDYLCFACIGLFETHISNIEKNWLIKEKTIVNYKLSFGRYNYKKVIKILLKVSML